MTTTSRTAQPMQGKGKKVSAGFLLSLVKCPFHEALTPPNFCITDDLVGGAALSGYTCAFYIKIHAETVPAVVAETQQVAKDQDR